MLQRTRMRGQGVENKRLLSVSLKRDPVPPSPGKGRLSEPGDRRESHETVSGEHKTAVARMNSLQLGLAYTKLSSETVL